MKKITTCNFKKFRKFFSVFILCVLTCLECFDQSDFLFNFTTFWKLLCVNHSSIRKICSH